MVSNWPLDRFSDILAQRLSTLPEVDGLLVRGAVGAAWSFRWAAGCLCVLSLPFLGAAGPAVGFLGSCRNKGSRMEPRMWGSQDLDYPPWSGVSPSEVSPGSMGLMLAARLVKKSLRKKRASCRESSGSDPGPGNGEGLWLASAFADLLTWSTLSLRGIMETRRQHSGPPTLLVGATCSALMVS